MTWLNQIFEIQYHWRYFGYHGRYLVQVKLSRIVPVLQIRVFKLSFDVHRSGNDIRFQKLYDLLNLPDGPSARSRTSNA